MFPEVAAEQLLVLAEAAADPDEAARLVFEAFLALSRTVAGQALLPLLDAMTQVARSSDSPRVEFLARTLSGVVAVRTGQPEGVELLESALDRFGAHGLDGDALYLECALLATLTLIRPHEARPRFAAHVDRLDLEPARRARLVAMIGLGDAWAGNLIRGQAEMLEARQLALAAGRVDIEAEVTSWLIKCEALRGDLAASAEHLARARELSARNGAPWVAAQVTEGAAALHFARGDTEAWAALLEYMVDSGIGTDSGLLFEYRWELATYRLERGDPGGARALLAGVPQPPPGWPGSPAMAAWRRWIEDPDDPATADAFEEALTFLVRPAERLPRARMAWLLARRRAATGRRADAIRLLEAACTGYAAIGAGGMLHLVAADLAAVTGGGSQPAPRAALAPAGGEPNLTGAEVRVAVAVADGLSNRETAQRLYVSVKTIEFHLGNIYRKLGVRNRTELAKQLHPLG
ncbi:hypothetical protein Cs7R123_55320 [Catellatospora sp. TT07R-123]|uniref:response regulator transcription factor n=1 Tax=Catellatospora sp. TT07R-123 TaxID=2733863 RepID=UPI001B017687|nr:helix-turn-helix transcriptional regulator [Catellatospora sp. TT07R-123]GHJ48190.1 hypothetical protein Cs7R123_55320 [Catellatospora sp. TT07R-123]